MCVLTSFYDFVFLLLSSHPWDACARLLHTGAHRVHLRGKNTKSHQKEVHIKDVIPSKSPFIDFFLSFAVGKTSRPEVFHLLDQYAFILQYVMRVGVFESGERVSPRICVKAPVPSGGEACLGFHVVGDIVDGAPQRDLSDRPRSVVGQVGGQHADPQLALQDRAHREEKPGHCEHGDPIKGF